jgi:methylmalonyl-CoA mutase
MQEQQLMFSEFDTASKKDWLNKVSEDLKGTSYQSLQWHTYEGFRLEPYYTRAEIKKLGYLTQLHNAPALASSGSGSPRQWVNNQYIRVKNEKDANSIALDALNQGADGIYFDVSRLTNLKLELLLKDIYLNHCSISFNAGSEAEHLLRDYLQYASAQGIRPEELSGMFNFDPVGEITETGLIDSDHFASFKATTDQTVRTPHFYGITVNTASFHDAGASAVQEIAFGLNIAVSYLHNLTEQGKPVEEAVEDLCISVSVGTSYFMEIAKLRAMRWLFSKIVQGYGLYDYQPGQLYLHAKTDIWSDSLTDPHVNMLRHTTQAMSAILGGCNALTIQPFDSTFADPSPFSRRISRNVSSILKEEAYFDKVADAAAGSYYIETITDKMIDEAWQLFLKVEDKGGFSRAFEKGFVQQEVRQVREQKLSDISRRKQKLVGVNAYCQPREPIPANLLSRLPAQEKLLKPQRRGIGYEKLRLRTEAFIAEGHVRPHALLLQFGDPAMRRARAGFATDLLGCAGFSASEFTVSPSLDQLNVQLQDLPTHIVVFCASDGDYEKYVPEMADKIRKSFHGLLLVAANPEALQEQVKHAAIDGFIHLKSDALDVLHEFQDKLFVNEIK